MGKREKTAVEFDAVNVSNDEISEFIPTTVNDGIKLIMELGVGNSAKLTANQKNALLTILTPYRGRDANKLPTDYYNIGGGQPEQELDGTKFSLLVPIKKTNKKGKVVDERKVNLLFEVRNITEGVTKFRSGKLAEFSSLSISSLYREDTLTPIDISF